jgi:DNA-directed RNA polymerase subunit RPC12/RpoP
VTLAVRERSGDRLFDAGEERSLDELVSTVWTSLSRRGSARCLVCGATVTRTGDESGGESAAECPGCGSRLE